MSTVTRDSRSAQLGKLTNEDKTYISSELQVIMEKRTTGDATLRAFKEVIDSSLEGAESRLRIALDRLEEVERGSERTVDREDRMLFEDFMNL